MFSREELARGFRELGVAAGDTVMVHASVRAVGPIAGGPDQIHLAIKDALTPDGTLMMYASCPDGYDDVGRGHLTPIDERELIEKLPAFDALTAKAQRDHGALVEFFRSYPGSLVNDHVARFVVWGGQAPYLISKQPWNWRTNLRLNISVCPSSILKNGPIRSPAPAACLWGKGRLKCWAIMWLGRVM